MEIVLVVWILCGVGAAVVASNRGASGCLWFGLGVLLGPIGFALAFTNSLPPCPFCRKGVPGDATKCPHCQSELSDSAALASGPFTRCGYCKSLNHRSNKTCS